MVDYVDPSQLTDGAVISADRWNQDVVNNTIFLYSPPYAKATGTGQTIQDDEDTIIELTASVDDNDSMVDLTNNQLTMTTAGMYVVVGFCELTGLSAGGRGYQWLVHSSGAVIASLAWEASSAANVPALVVTGQYFFAAGESVTLHVKQITTGTCNPNSFPLPYLAAHWLRDTV